jgi:serine/threonine protein kinase
LKVCVEGHEYLHKADFLPGDISINNLMINIDCDNPLRSSVLTDLDLAVKEQRKSASEAARKTGTRALVAIEALLGEHYSFRHDLE